MTRIVVAALVIVFALGGVAGGIFYTEREWKVRVELVAEERDVAIAERDAAIDERDVSRQDLDDQIKQTSKLFADYLSAIEQRDEARAEIDEWQGHYERAISQRDNAREQRDELEAERDRLAARVAEAIRAGVSCRWSESIADAREAIYRVCDANACGTAFHIGGGRWLASAHVVESTTASLYASTSYRGYDAWVRYRPAAFWMDGDTIWADAARHDYVVLESTHIPASSIRLATVAPAAGSTLRIMGYPENRWGTLTVTVVRNRLLGRVEYSDYLKGGSSGSPLIDECGLAYAIHGGHLLESPEGWGVPVYLMERVR